MERTEDDEKWLVQRSALLQLERLRANRNKPHWKTHSKFELIALLCSEFTELLRELVSERVYDPKAVRHECADAANILSMISQQCGVYGIGCSDVSKTDLITETFMPHGITDLEKMFNVTISKDTI